MWALIFGVLVQLRLMDSTVLAGYVDHLPAVYPLLAQLTGWCSVTVAIAACFERTRYASLSGAIAMSVSFALIAVTTFASVLQRHLLAPPASAHAAAITWYAIAAAGLALAGFAMRDHWHRISRGRR